MSYRKEWNDLRAPTRNRHNDRTTTPQPATFATSDTGNASGSRVAPRDQLSQVEDLAAARFRRQIENSIRLRGTEDPFDCLSWLDQSAVAETTESSEQAQTTTDQRPGSVDVHPPLRGKLVRLRLALLGRPADGLDLPAGVRRRVLGSLRDRRPLASCDPDPRRTTSAGRLPAVPRPRLWAVAEHREDVRSAGVGE